MPIASLIFIFLIAFIKIGFAELAASSAARLMLKTTSSICFCIPNSFSLSVTFVVLLGNGIFTSRFVKYPSFAERILIPFSIPLFSVSFKAFAASSSEKGF